MADSLGPGSGAGDPGNAAAARPTVCSDVADVGAPGLASSTVERTLASCLPPTLTTLEGTTETANPTGTTLSAADSLGPGSGAGDPANAAAARPTVCSDVADVGANKKRRGRRGSGQSPSQKNVFEGLRDQLLFTYPLTYLSSILFFPLYGFFFSAAGAKHTLSTFGVVGMWMYAVIPHSADKEAVVTGAYIHHHLD